MDVWTEDLRSLLYMTALSLEDPCLTSPYPGYLPDPQFVPLDFKNSSNKCDVDT